MVKAKSQVASSLYIFSIRLYEATQGVKIVPYTKAGKRNVWGSGTA
jgi:hypothetical protein